MLFPRYQVNPNRSTYLRFIAGLVAVKYLPFKERMHLAGPSGLICIISMCQVISLSCYTIPSSGARFRGQPYALTTQNQQIFDRLTSALTDLFNIVLVRDVHENSSSCNIYYLIFAFSISAALCVANRLCCLWLMPCAKAVCTHRGRRWDTYSPLPLTACPPS